MAGEKCESRDRNLGALIEGIGSSGDWRCDCRMTVGYAAAPVSVTSKPRASIRRWSRFASTAGSSRSSK